MSTETLLSSNYHVSSSIITKIETSWLTSTWTYLKSNFTLLSSLTKKNSVSAPPLPSPSNVGFLTSRLKGWEVFSSLNPNIFCP